MLPLLLFINRFESAEITYLSDFFPKLCFPTIDKTLLNLQVARVIMLAIELVAFWGIMSISSVIVSLSKLLEVTCISHDFGSLM